MSYKIEDWDQSKYLPPQKNPLPELDIVKALKSAWTTTLNSEPSIDSLAVLFSQIILENGPNLKYCKNYNCGNIKSLPNDGRCWTAFRCNEIINKVNQYFDPPNPICNFRAFKTADEGFVDYIKFLAQKKNYAKAWEQVLKGDPAEYVHQLKLAMYFTAKEEDYLKGVVSICNQFKSKYANLDIDNHIAPADDKPIEPFTPEEIKNIQNNIGLSLNKTLDEYFATSKIDDGEFDPTDTNYYTVIPGTWSKIKSFFGGK